MFAQRHDRAIRTLAGYLSKHDHAVMFPKRMISHEEKQIDHRNDELRGPYRRLREEKKGKLGR